MHHTIAAGTRDVSQQQTTYLIHYWKNTAGESDVQADWKQALDAFLLRGQQQGVFRVNIPAAAQLHIECNVARRPAHG